jgi:hypothetical protein
MEKIDLHNYEAWFLDFSENNLSESQINELTVFLKQHPELRVELEEFESIVLHDHAATVIENGFKENLMREESTGLTRLEYLMIAEVEGSISKKEKAELAALVAKQPSLLEELGIYHKTKLSQEELIIFAGKSDLIQKERKVIAWWMYASTAAAAAVIAFVMWNANTINETYAPRGFAWQPDQIKVEENLSTSIVSAEEVEIATNTKKVPLTNNTVQFAQEKSPKPPVLNKKSDKREIPVVVEPLEQEFAAKQPLEKLDDKEQENAPTKVITTDNAVENTLANVEPMQTKQEFVPIQKFAKDKIKKDLLKGKTFSETVAEELADISNDKITFEADKEKEGLFDSFALSIGKLSISRNR